MATIDERRRELDKRMLEVMSNHATIREAQEHMIVQLSHQHDCIESLKREIESSRVVLNDIKEIMSTLHVMSIITRWGVATTAAGMSAWHGAKAVINFLK